MPDRPDGRRKAKAAHATQVLQAKRMKLAETSIHLQEKHVFEIEGGNKMLLF